MTISATHTINQAIHSFFNQQRRILSRLNVLCLLAIASVLVLPDDAQAEEERIHIAVGRVLTDLQVTVHDHKLVPGTVAFNTVLKQLPGYERVGVDLNENAGGKFIYLWQKRERAPKESNCISRIFIVSGQNKHLGRTKGTETVLPLNLNQGTKSGSTFIYLGFTRIDPSKPYGPEDVISEVTVVAHKEVIVAKTSLGRGWDIMKYDDGRSDADLNVGAGGDYIYLFMRRVEDLFRS